MTDRLTALRLFLSVARLGSFSAAAREANLSQPSASRIIATLERDVGASLLTRTTHAVMLTETGFDYLLRVEAILAAIDEADHLARGGGELRGLLRLAASPTFITREIVSRLGGFMKRHPNLRVDLVAAGHRLDILSAGIDVAIRFGAPPDISAVGLKLAEAPRVLVAAPSWLRGVGTPTTPDNLAGLVAIAGPAGRQRDTWTLRRGAETVSVQVRSQLSFSDNDSAVAATVAGLGMTSTGFWGCRAEIADGRLVRLLPEWDLGVVEVHALFAAGRSAKPSARAMVGYLRQELRDVSRPR